MTHEEFQAIIHRLVLEEGIPITLQVSKGELVHNLHTGMKSHLWIRWLNNTAYYEARYGDNGTFDNWDELLAIAARCMCSRDYASQPWLDLLCKEGYLTRTVTTHVSYA